jgi:CRISPR-associated exonuclease Cas4
MDWRLTATDLKQYAYCHRVFYYMRCLPGVRPVTRKMEEGILAGESEEERESRRQLRRYGCSSGDRVYHVLLESASLGLRAVADMAILRPDGRPEVIPVDFKLSRMVGRHFKIQLACYGLLLEECYGLAAPVGYIYSIPERQAEKVALTARLRSDTRAQLSRMRLLVEREAVPEATSERNRCVNCEFRLFCNDVF